jgi:hypothetical protein
VNPRNRHQYISTQLVFLNGELHQEGYTIIIIMINVKRTEGTTKNGQFRETDNIGYIRRRPAKQDSTQHSVGHHYNKTNTSNVNKT